MTTFVLLCPYPRGIRKFGTARPANRLALDFCIFLTPYATQLKDEKIMNQDTN